MRFTTTAPEPAETPVLVALLVDADGEIALEANGISVLWLRNDGTITLNRCDPDQLEALGFRLSADGRVKLTHKES